MIRGALCSYFFAALAAASLAGCMSAAKPKPTSSYEPIGTCEAACSHYLECKGDQQRQSRDTCMAECREIYVYEGEPDFESLAIFQQLECSKAISFVEGTGAAPNTASTDSAARPSRAAGTRSP